MIELGLLGTTRVPSITPDSTALVSRRKHFGLLVYLAMEPEGFHRRGVLCGMLWPETDERRARRSLRVALHHIRESLGPDAIRSRDDGAVGVDPTHVTTDVARLQRAVDQGNAAEVARLYRGAFLPGFHTGEDPFDRWIEEQRLSLERRATDAIHQGAADALSRGEWRHTAALAADLLRIRPTDVPGIEIRVEALRRLGSVGRALEDLGHFREHFEKELELPAPERIRELEDAIRARAREPETIPAGTGEPPRPEPEVEPTGLDGPAVPPVPSHASSDTARTARRGVARLLSGPGPLGVGAVLVAGLGIFGVLQLRGGGTVPERPASPHVPTAEGLRLLEEGRALRNDGSFREAMKHYGAAVEEDPEWGEAWLELALAAHWAGEANLAWSALEEALPLRPGMDDAARDLTAAMNHARRGDLLVARELHLGVVDGSPDDLRALMELGELEFHWGATIGTPPETSRPRFERVYALTGSAQALLHLARLDARGGDTASLALRLRALEEQGAASELAEVRVLDALFRDEILVPSAVGEGLLGSVVATAAPPGRREDFLESLVRETDSDRLRALGTIFRGLVALEGGRLSEASEWFDRLAPYSEARRDEFQAFSLVLPFRPPRPTRREALAARLEARENDILVGPTDSELPAPAIYAPRRIFLHSLLQGSGRTAPDAEAFSGIAQRSWADTAHINHHARVLQARTSMEGNMALDTALAALGPPAIHPGRIYPSVLSYPVAYERYLRARMLHSLGREREALAWYRTFPDPRGYDVAFLPAILLGRSGVERTLGMEDEARATLTRLVALLEDADPEYRTLANLARNDLEELRR